MDSEFLSLDYGLRGWHDSSTGLLFAHLGVLLSEQFMGVFLAVLANELLHGEVFAHRTTAVVVLLKRTIHR